MKKATFIITTLLATLYLTGCGSNNDTEVKELQERVSLLEAELEASHTSDEVDAADDSTQSNETSDESVKSTEENNSTVVISSTSLEIPQISKDNEDIMVTMFYCGNSFNCKVVSETNLGTLPNIELPFYGEEVRDVSLVISGVTVNAIYKVENGTWKQVANISYDKVDNTYLAEVYVEGSEDNTFMIQTVNGNHYYVAIKY